MIEVIPDSQKTHWVNRAPESIRPYLQLSRLDRPVGYWLLTLPGWIGLAFAGLSHGLNWEDLKWAILILIGAIAMRGAGCTYNDIVDQDLDAQVERTALRPLPAGTVTNKQAWIWLFIQCGVGLIVLLCLPRLAQIVSLFSIPLVAAYPFMKRITWWPQIWLGLTFNWAFLVAESIKIDSSNLHLLDAFRDQFSLGFYLGLVFWTIGYDTIYACQDTEDDAIIGIKSTARKFGRRVKLGVALSYLLSLFFIFNSFYWQNISELKFLLDTEFQDIFSRLEFYGPPSHIVASHAIFFIFPFALHLFWQVLRFKLSDDANYLKLFKSNVTAAFILIVTTVFMYSLIPYLTEWGFHSVLWPWHDTLHLNIVD